MRYRSSHRLAAFSNFGVPRSGYRWRSLSGRHGIRTSAFLSHFHGAVLLHEEIPTRCRLKHLDLWVLAARDAMASQRRADRLCTPASSLSYSLASVAGALMIGGVFLLARDPRALAEWYRRHLGWELGYLAAENAYYIELYYSELDRPEQHQHLVFAIMPGDPGEPGQGHVINYRVDDVDAILARLHEDGVDTSAVTVGADAEGQGKFVRLHDPEGHRIELWQHLDES
jgi:glyoxylase I family protein